MTNPHQQLEQPVITMSTLGNYGRFGNQITQYAFLKIYAQEHNLRVETPKDWIGHYLFGRREQPISQQLPRVQQSSQEPNRERILNTEPFLYNIDLQGYFQYHTQYYAPYKDYFRSLFRPLPTIESPIAEAVKFLRSVGKTLVGLHLRRGDYGYQHFFVAPNEWYLVWLKQIWQDLDRPVLFIASDEPEKVVDDFREYSPIISNNLGLTIPLAEFYPDFYILSQCDIVAISNSSFSFTACMLNECGRYFLRPSLATQSLTEFEPWDSEIILTDRTVEESASIQATIPNQVTHKVHEQAVNLPVHFFTMVLNGEPFIRYHIEIFKRLKLQWQWHIVEGVIAKYGDGGWTFRSGEYISAETHCNGCSNDGTSQYIDELAALYPDNITVYRKSGCELWDGQVEMLNTFPNNIQTECLLWQVDVDEFWTVEQIHVVHQMFQEHPEKTAAFYWCWFFVGERLVISTSYCYTQDPKQEWLRTWRFKPGMIWVDDGIPHLMELTDCGWQDVAFLNPFMHHNTEKRGLIFQHFAYVMPKQVEFKQIYFGYKNAVLNWQNLQTQSIFPVLLSRYFSWVQDHTTVDTTESLGIVPIAYRDPIDDTWKFLISEATHIDSTDDYFEHLCFQEINLLLFPDWRQKRELVCQDLTKVLISILGYSQGDRIMLLIYAGNANVEQVDEILAEAAMNLLMQEDLEFEQEPQISIVRELFPLQWQALLSKVQARIELEYDDKAAIASVAAENIPRCSVEQIASLALQVNI